jgi:hypothetical protein
MPSRSYNSYAGEKIRYRWLKRGMEGDSRRA